MTTNTGMPLRTKLISLTVATVVALCVFFAVALSNEKAQLLADRQDKIRNVVEVAHGVLDGFYKQEKAGKITREEAQAQVKEILRGMRYDKVEYFWINDMGPTTIMHAIRPELEGKDQTGNIDKAGKALYVEFVKVVRASGGGFVDYYWTKPGSDAVVPKLSYVKGFEPWGWIVGSGVYIDDVDAIFKQNAIKFLAWGLLIGGFIAVSLTLVSRNLIKTLGGDPLYAAMITRRIAAGDLTAEVDCAPGDTTSVLAGMKEMQHTLRKMIEEIVRGAEQLSSASEQLLHASEEVAMRSRQQSESASAMAAAVEEMTVSIDQVAENASEAHTITIHAGDLSNKGTHIIQNASTEMHKLSEAVQSSSRVIEELGSQSNQITSIVNTIKEIADQTNLLALNAAIEAARAGEQGRGFAVVADEVRKLAERTSLSTTEIAGMVGKIQNGTRTAVESMETGVAQAVKSVDLASQAGTSITEIRDGSMRVMDVVNSISDAIREQGAASSEIARNIEQIASMSEEGARAVQQTTEAARHLQQLSASLHASVSRFKLRG
jgi:methyl-accepting chemotaxis protein